MKLKSTTHEVPLTVSRDNLISAIVTQLQAFKAIPSSVNLLNIVDIKFEDFTKDPVQLKLIMKEEADVLIF